MSLIERRFLEDRIIDHTKLDPTDSYTVKRMSVGPDGTFSLLNNVYSIVFNVDNKGNILANSIKTLDQTSEAFTIAKGSNFASNWHIEPGTAALGDLRIRMNGVGNGLIYMDGINRRVGIDTIPPTSHALTVNGGARVVGDVTATGKADFNGNLWVGSDASVTGHTYLGPTTILSEFQNALDVSTSADSIGLYLNTSGVYYTPQPSMFVVNDAQDDPDNPTQFGDAIIASSINGYALRAWGSILISTDATVQGNTTLSTLQVNNFNNYDIPAIDVTASPGVNGVYGVIPAVNLYYQARDPYGSSQNTLNVENEFWGSQSSTFGTAIRAIGRGGNAIDAFAYSAIDPDYLGFYQGYALNAYGDVYISGDATITGRLNTGSFDTNFTDVHMNGKIINDSLRVVRKRIVDSNLDLTPDSGDADTDNIIASLVDIIKRHGLAAPVSGADYLLTVTSDPDMIIDDPASGEVLLYTPYQYTVTTEEDMHGSGAPFRKWVVISGNATFYDEFQLTTEVTISEDTTIKALQKRPFTLIIQIDSNIDHTTSDPVPDGPTADSYWEQEGGVLIYVSAFPKEGYLFKQWVLISGDTETIYDTDANPAMVTLVGNAIIKAESIAKPTYLLTVVEDPGILAVYITGGIYESFEYLGTPIPLVEGHSYIIDASVDFHASNFDHWSVVGLYDVYDLSASPTTIEIYGAVTLSAFSIPL